MSNPKSIEDLLSEILSAKPGDWDFKSRADQIQWVIRQLDEQVKTLGKQSISRPPQT